METAGERKHRDNELGRHVEVRPCRMEPSWTQQDRGWTDCTRLRGIVTAMALKAAQDLTCTAFTVEVYGRFLVVSKVVRHFAS